MNRANMAEELEENVPDVTNTKYLVAFDSDLRGVFPTRSDSETDDIIQKLKRTLATPPKAVPEDSANEFQTEGILVSATDRQVQPVKKTNLLGLQPVKNVENRKHLTMEEVIITRSNEHFTQGIEHSQQGQFEAAIACFNKATNLQSQSISFYIERAETFIQLCDFNSAALNYKHAYTLEPHNPYLSDKMAFICYLEGQCLFDQGLYSDALKCFTNATEIKPSCTGYHMRAIACLATLGRHHECLALIARIMESQSTNNSELLVMRARLHEMFGNTTLCYYDLRDALVLEPLLSQANALMDDLKAKAKESKRIASVLTIEGKYHEAVNRITKSISTDPSVADFHVFRGALYRRLKDFNAAIDDYISAMDKCDHDETKNAYKDAEQQLLITYNDFAVHCYQQGFYEESIILLNKAIKGEKNKKGLYINRGDCFFKLGDLTFALSDYEQALEIEMCWKTRCRIAVVHNELGIVAYKERIYQDALKHFTAAIVHNPKVSMFYVHRARARYMSQDVASAQQDVLVSLLLDPNNDEAIPLLSRLFPGRSVSEVLQSQIAQKARKQLKSVVDSDTKSNRDLGVTENCTDKSSYSHTNT